jgi:hypothetical protein
VLARPHRCLPARPGLQSLYGKESLLDNLHGARPASGLSAADLVGPGRNRSHPVYVMVGCLSQRLVLSPAISGLGHGETAAYGVASRATGHRPIAGDRSAGERIRRIRRAPAHSRRPGHGSVEGKGVAARLHNIFNGAGDGVVRIHLQGHCPGHCSSIDGETASAAVVLGKELKARDA